MQHGIVQKSSPISFEVLYAACLLYIDKISKLKILFSMNGGSVLNFTVDIFFPYVPSSGFPEKVLFRFLEGVYLI